MLPVAVPHLAAGLLTLFVLVIALWALLHDDPFGGEPIAIVSTDGRAPPAAQKAGEPGASTPAKPQVGNAAAPAGASMAAAAGSKTITIIDGTSGKRQEVAIPSTSEPEHGGATVDQRLIESSPHGAIPKIAGDGARAEHVYARPVKIAADKAQAPRVAIVISGLGVSAAAITEALGKLPAPVTFAFTPYGIDVDRWVGRARGDGHEILLQVPMEPFDYPDNDPGPQALLTSTSAEQNIDRLHWFMSRISGYVGVTNYMGARFTATESALGPVLREIAQRGLIYFDDGRLPRSLASQSAGASNGPFGKADVVVDAVPAPEEIDKALERLEALARERRVAIGVANALPASIERIAQWARAAESRGIVLVPISMAARKAKST
jgi:polysaccharide deacetylase 2 family uncharacterized protein YibQ